MSDPDVRWTAKAPALAAGIVLLVLGVASLRGKWRYASVGGLLLVIAGGGFIGWSLTIKEWCSERNMAQSAFASAFSGSFHACLRQKGWLEF